MTYTNITGVNVGNCLTGFGIHFPVTVINDGNSEVLYSFAVTNSTNFSLSSSSVSLYPSNSVFGYLSSSDTATSHLVPQLELFHEYQSF